MKELILFAVPLILSGILQQLYGWADALIVGNIEGELALGAIGGTGVITHFLVNAMNGLAIGINVLAGQKYGSRDMGYVKKILHIFTYAMGGLFLLLALLAIPFSDALLAMLRTPADIHDLAKIYLQIVFAGIPFLAIYNVYSAIVRGVGDSKAPLYSIVVSSVMNVILDFIFVWGFRMGVQGAAAATVIAQISMTIFMMLYGRKKHAYLFAKAPEDAASRKKDVFLTTLRYGVPPMIQSCITSAGNLILQDFQNSFGTATVIAITCAYRVDSVAMLPVVNLGSAIATLTAQSYGAGDREAMRRKRKEGLIVMIVVSLVLTGLIIPFGATLVRMFGAGEAAVAIGAGFFVRLASFYVIFGLTCAMRGYLEGVGDMVFASSIGFVMLFTRIAASYAFAGVFGNMVIAYAEGFSWIVGLLLYIPRVRKK